MSKSLRLYLMAATALLFGAFVVQTFFPLVGGDGTNWGFAPGWQREIGFWNVGMIVIIVSVLASKDVRSAKHLVRGLLVLSTLLGTNHLVAIVSDPTGWAHYTPMIVNYIAVVWGWINLRAPSR